LLAYKLLRLRKMIGAFVLKPHSATDGFRRSVGGIVFAIEVRADLWLRQGDREGEA
jgi:hypothetical protein